jgi:hypothetical protein
VTLPTAPVPPIAVGVMELGTGYLIYGTQDLFGFLAAVTRRRPWHRRLGHLDARVQVVFQGIFLFVALTLFGTLTSPPLSVYGGVGVHCLRRAGRGRHGLEPNTRGRPGS